MSKVFKYQEFLREGIVSKAMEIINYKKVKENDKIAKKYINMIYENYEKHKNLMAVKISQNKGYTTLWYKISDDPYAQAGTAGGEYPDFIEVELMSINEFGWGSDITRARIEVERKGRKLIGRDMESDELVTSETGIQQNVFSYLNISQSQVDKLIKFFKSEYIKKYPEMSVNKYFNYTGILQCDKELKDKLESNYKERRKNQEDNFKKFEEFAKDFLDKNSSETEEDIKDYFIELTDKLKETFNASLSVNTVFISDDLLITRGTFLSKTQYFTRKEIGPQSSIPDSMRPGRVYQILDYKMDMSDEIGSNDGGYVNYHEAEKFLETEYSLSTDKIKNKNPKFKLIAIGDPDHSDLKLGIFKSILNNMYRIIIILEEI